MTLSLRAHFDLFTINTNTGAGALVGKLPSTSSTEIEFNNDTRRAFTGFLSFGGQEFDINTGAALAVPIENTDTFYGMEWVGSSLYVASNQIFSSVPELWVLNPTTGKSSLIGPTGIFEPIQGLAYDEGSGIMYGIAGTGFSTPSKLVTLSLTTGQATVIGPVPFSAGSLEFGPDGNLYAGSTNDTGDLFRIDKATGASTLIGPTGFSNITGLALVKAPVVPPNTVKFSATTANVTETPNATTKIDLVVTRTGTTTGEAAIEYSTSDDTASERSDYLAARGILHFAANETSKTIPVFVVDDSLGEGAETSNVTLSNPVGCTLGSPATIVITIDSNEAVNGPNPLDDPGFNTDFFVRQHYLDFLNREPDASGLAFWKNQIDECTTAGCREVRKINVSAAFFLSIEFQETGYLVYKANQAAFNTQEFLDLGYFLADQQQIGRGVVIGQPGADSQLETNRQKFFIDFVQRPEFLEPTAYPNTMTAEHFVDKLNANTFDPIASVSAGALTANERSELIGELSGNPASPALRAQVLRSVVENLLFSRRQFNKAFVLMQYFGYLRRRPNDAPEALLDFAGYNFWLRKLNEFNGNFVSAEMVKAFIASDEYRGRFGP